MNFLQLTNEVLKRLRETQVDSVSFTEYSTLIGIFVNEAKREVEDAHDWNSLNEDILFPTVVGQRDYTLSTTSHRTVIKYAYNLTKKWWLNNLSLSQMTRRQELNFTPVNNDVINYTVTKKSATGSLIVRLDPYPISVQQIVFNVKNPQAQLVNNLDELLVPAEPVILNAYLRAINERGEDNGNLSQIQQEKYLSSLRDHIAIDKNYNDDDTLWVA